MKDLEARLRRLEDTQQIQQLRLTYHRHINGGDFAKVADLFTLDGVIDLGYMARYKGRDEIHQGFIAMPGRISFIKQFIHNHIVELDGDRAKGTCFMEARYGRGKQSYNVAGRYDDEYVRNGEGWLISVMKFDAFYSLPIDKGWVDEERHYLKDNIQYTQDYRNSKGG